MVFVERFTCNLPLFCLLWNELVNGHGLLFPVLSLNWLGKTSPLSPLILSPSRPTVDRQSADSWPTVGRQVFWGALLHNYLSLCFLQFVVPALFFQWEGLFQCQEEQTNIHKAVINVVKKWSHNNLWGRVVLLKLSEKQSCEGDNMS